MLNDKKGQVTIFIIIAILLVGGIIAYLFLSGRISPATIPQEFSGIYQAYDSCIQTETRAAISLLESQSGRIYPDVYQQGSDYAPYGNQLNFLGFPVPYWYYIGGNGVARENVPTSAEMEADIAKYINENLNKRCNLDSFYQQGFYINLGTPKASVDISDSNVQVSLSADISATSAAGATARKTSYSISMPSKLGALYSTALDVYNYEKQNSFLENYSVDVLRQYAPVDGVEISCAGKVWKTREVINDLLDGLEANIGSIKMTGNYYSLSSGSDKYFVVSRSVDNAVNLLYSRSWPTRIEVYGNDGELLMAKPVGNQPGLGTMGFCYAPYHFVYDMGFPVMIQVSSGTEIFQFPVVVIIDKNIPREGYSSELKVDNSSFDLCAFNTQRASVDIYDINLNRVDANVSFECFNQECPLGESSGGIVTGNIPACVNGYLIARADGYVEKKQLFSSNEETSAEIILDRLRKVKISVNVDGKPASSNVMVTFAGERSAGAFLPGNDEIELSEGFYNISVYVYGNSSLTLPASSKTQCSEVPQSGVLGFFGATKQQCFDITIPETKIESALIGGGSAETYIFDSELAGGRVTLDVSGLPSPKTIDDLQANYATFEQLGAGVEFG